MAGNQRGETGHGSASPGLKRLRKPGRCGPEDWLAYSGEPRNPSP